MSADLPLWIEVDLEAVRRNVERLKSLLNPGTAFLAVVKANGYGHGDAPTAGAALAGGAEWLGVARVEEGASLREAGISHPVLLLAEPPPEACSRAVSLDLVPTLYTREVAAAFSDAATGAGKALPVHVKVDTGMHRYGVAPVEAASFLGEVSRLPGLEVGGIWSHFAVAEDVQNPYTRRQLEIFLEVLDRLAPPAGVIRHLANSAAILTFPESHLDMVRAGMAVYGIHPSPALAGRVELEPALTMKSRVGHTKRLGAGEPISYGQTYTSPRETTVATVPCGYADGLRRALGNRGEVLIGGRRYRISGTITMDHFLVDVGDDDVKIGDEVVMIGDQGGESITATEIAGLLDTIPYEVVCSLSGRVTRLYRGDAAAGS